MPLRIDRKKVSVGKMTDFQKEDREYWSKATIEEKLEMINYLRECFYGPEATTGRLQRIFRFTKQKQS